MKIDFQILLDSVGLLQGTLLGVFLIIMNDRKHKSTLFLGLFLLFFSLKLGHFIARNLNYIDDYPSLFLLPFNFSWLLFPLFFIYSQKISVFSNQKLAYWVLLPGVISFFIQLFIFFLPYETKVIISNSPWHDIFFTFIGILYSWAIALWNLKILNQHGIEVRNSYSQLQAKELQWAKYFLLYSLLVSILIHILYYISPQNFWFKILFSILDLIAIYWISFHGVKQRNVLSILDTQNIYSGFSNKKSNKIMSQSNSYEDLQILMKQLNQYVVSSSCFTDTNLTIVDVAKSINEHPKRISTTINTIRKENFNSYINHLRVKKAEVLLKNIAYENLSIEGIGNKVGFHSKSSFYTAFKKVTGTTPSKFKEKVVA